MGNRPLRRHTTMADAFAKVGLIETHPRGFVEEPKAAYPLKFHRSGEEKKA